MTAVWRVFETLAVILVAVGLLAATRHGPRADAYRVVGHWLVGLGVGTALFSALLGPLGPWFWAGACAVFVAALSAILTVRAIRRARASMG